MCVINDKRYAGEGREAEQLKAPRDAGVRKRTRGICGVDTAHPANGNDRKRVVHGEPTGKWKKNRTASLTAATDKTDAHAIGKRYAFKRGAAEIRVFPGSVGEDRFSAVAGKHVACLRVIGVDNDCRGAIIRKEQVLAGAGVFKNGGVHTAHKVVPHRRYGRGKDW
ncbi:unknown [Clostridium sp. CAG:448]|nr:unknown [Clostridium sp. CAG:448]